MSTHIARKRFGQNFLVDTAVIDAIIRAIAPQTADCIVEIGPGLSALTDPLLERVQPLTVIEIDRQLVARLQQKYSSEQIHILNQDVLTVDFSQWQRKIRVVGNLPYNISSPLLFHLLDFKDYIIDQHFMLQKEVVDRMVAQPGDAAYSRLSVQLQAYYDIEKLFDVPATAFNPAPKVTSSIVRLIPLPESQQMIRYPRAFSQLVSKAFMQRRKMLRKSLSDWEALFDWTALNCRPTDRPDAVSIVDFYQMTQQLVAQGILKSE